MTGIFFRLFGMGADTRHVTGWHLTVRGGGWAATMLLIAVILCAACFYLYQRESIDRSKRRRTLIVLRCLLLLGLIGILLEPRVRFTIEQSVRRSLLVLVDGTSSMTIHDPRTEQPDLVRAGIALGDCDPEGGVKQMVSENDRSALTRPAREELVVGALNNPRLGLLKRLEANQDIRPFSFADRVTDLPTDGGKWVNEMHFSGQSTAIGDSLRDLLARTRGQPLSGVFLITDGANNAGTSPAAAAEMAGRAGVPLYIWGVGLPSPRDIFVSSIYSEDVAFVDDQVNVTVRVSSSGLVGKSAEMILKQDDAEVARQPIHFDADGEQVVQLQFTPKKAGDFKLTALVPPREDEVVKDNNQQSTTIRIVDGKIKVLLIDQRPRWEFKYLQAMLLRDRRVELKCLLQSADSGMSTSPDSIYLAHLPSDKKDLFKYDVIIIGDMNVQDVVRGQLQTIKQYVSDFGGGVVFIAGPSDDPSAYGGTPLADLLPIEPLQQTSIPIGGPGGGGGRTGTVHVELTAAGKAAHMLRLSDTEAASDAIWAALPPIFFDATVGRAKPGAEVLAIDPSPEKAIHDDKMPVIAIQQYGIGQVLYVGTDNTWRWRKNVGDKYYTLMWGQIVQRLALPHLLGASKKTRITLDKKQYSTGERVTVMARLYGEGFDPLSTATATAGYQPAGGTGGATAGATAGRQLVQLRALPEQPGMYSGEFFAPVAGSYEFSVDNDPKVLEPFDVVEPKLEMGETAMNEKLLRQMAQASGGEFYREEDLFHLPDAVQKKSETTRTTVDVPLWSSPIYFLTLLGLVTAEWILRKMSDLK